MLTWSLIHGKHAEGFIEQLIQDNVPEDEWPDFIRDRPQLEPGLDFFLNAFNDLSTCRHIGMGVGPIPYTAMMEYCCFHGFDDETSRLLVMHVSEMDRAFMAFQSQESDKRRSEAAAKSTSKRARRT